MATHSSVLAWRIPGMGSHRVGHNCSDLAVAVVFQLKIQAIGFLLNLINSVSVLCYARYKIPFLNNNAITHSF